MKIPFPISKLDRNGIIYTKETIEKAVREFDGVAPLMMVKDEISTVIGYIEKLELSDNYEVTAHGIIIGGEAVKHGGWFLLDEYSNAGVYCSVCYKKVYKTDYANQKVKSKYCPNCGAVMDLEGE